MTSITEKAVAIGIKHGWGSLTDLVDALRTLTEARTTGTLYIMTDDDHWGRIAVGEGAIQAMSCRGVDGAQALKFLLEMRRCLLTFDEGSLTTSLSHGRRAARRPARHDTAPSRAGSSSHVAPSHMLHEDVQSLPDTDELIELLAAASLADEASPPGPEPDGEAPRAVDGEASPPGPEPDGEAPRPVDGEASPPGPEPDGEAPRAVDGDSDLDPMDQDTVKTILRSVAAEVDEEQDIFASRTSGRRRRRDRALYAGPLRSFSAPIRDSAPSAARLLLQARHGRHRVSGTMVRHIIEEETVQELGPMGQLLVSDYWRQESPRSFRDVESLLVTISEEIGDDEQADGFMQRVTQRILMLAQTR